MHIFKCTFPIRLQSHNLFNTFALESERTNGSEIQTHSLRMVLTTVSVHTFCASCKTWFKCHTCARVGIDTKYVKFERIQRRATRFILKSNEPYDVCLDKLNLLTLEQRPFGVNVTFLFKTLNGHLDVDISQVLDFYGQEDR